MKLVTIMLIVTNPLEAQQVEDEAVRRFLLRRIAQLGQGAGGSDLTIGGQWVVVQEGDRIERIDAVIGMPVLRGLFDDAPFGSADYAPCFEWISDHGAWYEMLFVTNDDGAFSSLVIPRRAGIDGQLLALCAAYATPEPVQL